jgi:hypothetical protein
MQRTRGLDTADAFGTTGACSLVLLPLCAVVGAYGWILSYIYATSLILKLGRAPALPWTSGRWNLAAVYHLPSKSRPPWRVPVALLQSRQRYCGPFSRVGDTDFYAALIRFVTSRAMYVPYQSYPRMDRLTLFNCVLSVISLRAATFASRTPSQSFHHQMTRLRRTASSSIFIESTLCPRRRAQPSSVALLSSSR